MNYEIKDFKFKKKYGQNFLIEENIINNIILKSDIKPNSLVIEIGPGAGALTKKLCEVSTHVLCYEIDSSLNSILSNNLSKYNNVKIIYDDFLKCNLKKDLMEYKYDNLYIISNLPYYITTPIINRIIFEKIDITKMMIMVQKEVLDRFIAKVNTKDYNFLSVVLNYYYDIKKELIVSKNVFIPKPNVDSAVISFTKKEKKEIIKDENLFLNLVKDSFKQKRKTIKNNLDIYNLNNIEKSLKKLNYDLSIRAEQLTLNDFIFIANNYEE